MESMRITIEHLSIQVGLLEVSSDDVKKRGLSGRGLKLLHHYPDLLWGLGSKTTPDDSFTPTRVFPQASTLLRRYCSGRLCLCSTFPQSSYADMLQWAASNSMSTKLSRR